MQLQLYFGGTLCIFSARMAKTRYIFRHSGEMDVPFGSCFRMSGHIRVNIHAYGTYHHTQQQSSCMQSIRAQILHMGLTSRQPATCPHSCWSTGRRGSAYCYHLEITWPCRPQKYHHCGLLFTQQNPVHLAQIFKPKGTAPGSHQKPFLFFADSTENISAYSRRCLLRKVKFSFRADLWSSNAVNAFLTAKVG